MEEVVDDLFSPEDSLDLEKKEKYQFRAHWSFNIQINNNIIYVLNKRPDDTPEIT